jgi:serine/threonine protein kinase
MELVEGETLATRLGRAGTISAAETAALLADVADVLGAVHTRGIVHRDLKPDNLLLTPRDRDYPLRVIDWGVARLGPIGRLTLDGLTPGTPIYMSPEQATGRHIAAPCDIYSLGVIAYEALSGHPPFDGRTLAEVVAMHLASEAAPLRERCNAPVELCKLIHRMLHKHPDTRPMAIEVRQITRALALELAGAYEELEISGIPPRAVTTVPTDETLVVDPEALEYGVTELLPTMRKPRWTPEIATIPQVPRRGPITPKSGRYQVAGEIHPRRR